MINIIQNLPPMNVGAGIIALIIGCFYLVILIAEKIQATDKDSKKSSSKSKI